MDPLLTPIAIDPAHPFPRVLNKALCLALLLRPKRRSSGPQVLGVVTVPRALPRFVRLPATDGRFDYLLLQDLIAQNLAGMYRGYEVLAHAAFRVTRNSNLYFEEEEARSLLEIDSRRAAQPPQGRRRSPGDRDRRSIPKSSNGCA